MPTQPNKNKIILINYGYLVAQVDICPSLRKKLIEITGSNKRRDLAKQRKWFSV
eukprot:m.59239 g.59239  ORF g.59239 m.59239 type:complete len:54 (-) comp49228_c0_seq4:174-335(-)